MPLWREGSGLLYGDGASLFLDAIFGVTKHELGRKTLDFVLMHLRKGGNDDQIALGGSACGLSLIHI